MTELEQMKMLMTMVGEESEEVLSTYLALAGEKIRERLYPYESEEKTIPIKYHIKQVEIAAYMLNKRGAEGQTTHTENGITRVYENGDVPESMLRGIAPYCGVIR